MTGSGRRYLRWFYLWHRRIGVAAATLFIILVVTGIALNHTTELDLEHHAVTNPLLLGWYGMATPSAKKVFRVNNQYVSQFNDHLFLNKRPLSSATGALINAVESDGLLLVLTQENLFAYTVDGELVESQALPSSLLGKVEKAGVTIDGHLLVLAEGHYQSIGSDMLGWKEVAATQLLNWSEPAPLPEALAQSLRSDNSPLKLERVMLDLHSGRLFGRYGIYVMDAAAVVLLLLSLSGFYLWLQHHRRRRHTRR